MFYKPLLNLFQVLYLLLLNRHLQHLSDLFHFQLKLLKLLHVVELICMITVVIVASRDLIVLPRKPHSSTNNYNHFNLHNDSYIKYQ